MAYNRASNNPVKKHHHPRYVKIDKVSLGVLIKVFQSIASYHTQSTNDVVNDHNVFMLIKLVG